MLQSRSWSVGSSICQSINQPTRAIMADEAQTAETVVEKVSQVLTDFVNKTVGDSQNVTAKEPATPEGQVIDYACFVGPNLLKFCCLLKLNCHVFKLKTGFSCCIFFQAVAYVSLVLMAVLPIFYGSFRSVKYQDKQKVRRIHL